MTNNKRIQEALAAFRAGRNYNGVVDRVTVQFDPAINASVIRWIQYGNVIAERKDGILTLSHCGWSTKTTKARLNAILASYALPTIRQIDFVWHLTNARGFDKVWNNPERFGV